jgi:hypothetical protein
MPGDRRRGADAERAGGAGRATSGTGAVSEGYRLATTFFSVVIIGFGIAIVVVTLANGGGPLAFGTLIGVAFAAMGAGRLYLALRDRPPEERR